MSSQMRLTDRAFRLTDRLLRLLERDYTRHGHRTEIAARALFPPLRNQDDPLDLPVSLWPVNPSTDRTT
jgi:hypothetical protein